MVKRNEVPLLFWALYLLLLFGSLCIYFNPKGCWAWWGLPHFVLANQPASFQNRSLIPYRFLLLNCSYSKKRNKDATTTGCEWKTVNPHKHLQYRLSIWVDFNLHSLSSSISITCNLSHFKEPKCNSGLLFSISFILGFRLVSKAFLSWNNLWFISIVCSSKCRDYVLVKAI